MTGTFRRDLHSLGKIFDFIGEFANANTIDNSTSFKLKFIIEELFTNLVKYNSEGEDTIAVSLEKENHKVILALHDVGGVPFDLTTAREVDIHQPLQDRKPGGLGIHLVRKFADEIRDERVNKKRTITVITHVEQ